MTIINTRWCKHRCTKLEQLIPSFLSVQAKFRRAWANLPIVEHLTHLATGAINIPIPSSEIKVIDLCQCPWPGTDMVIGGDLEAGGPKASRGLAVGESWKALVADPCSSSAEPDVRVDVKKEASWPVKVLIRWITHSLALLLRVALVLMRKTGICNLTYSPWCLCEPPSYVWTHFGLKLHCTYFYKKKSILKYQLL